MQIGPSPGSLDPLGEHFAATHQVFAPCLPGFIDTQTAHHPRVDLLVEMVDRWQIGRPP
jgi:hypothetical protein